MTYSVHICSFCYSLPTSNIIQDHSAGCHTTFHPLRERPNLLELKSIRHFYSVWPIRRVALPLVASNRAVKTLCISCGTTSQLE